MGRVKFCKYCGALIVWYKAPFKRWIAVDEATADPSTETFDIKTMKPHYRTCTSPKSYNFAFNRKKEKSQDGKQMRKL